MATDAHLSAEDATDVLTVDNVVHLRGSAGVGTSDISRDVYADTLLQIVSDKLIVISGLVDADISQSLVSAGAAAVLQFDSRSGISGLRSFCRDTCAGSLKAAADSGTVALLKGRSAFALRSRRFCKEFDTVLLPVGFSLFAGALGILKYITRRKIAYAGLVRIDGFSRPLASFRVLLSRTGATARQYYLTRDTAKEILGKIGDLDAVALDDIDVLEDGWRSEPLEILVSSAHSDKAKFRLKREIGTSVALYNVDGSNDLDIKCLPFFPPFMAAEILKTSVPSAYGYRVPRADWHYLASAFRLLVHRSADVPPGMESLDETRSISRHVAEIRRLATAAGLRPPLSFSDIATVLDDVGVLPVLDGLGARSIRNPFLDDRYRLRSRHFAPGLSFFVVRDFNLGAGFIDAVRDRLQRSGLSVLVEREFDPAENSTTLSLIRGGNWYDAMAPSGFAPMNHVFICFNPKPEAARGDLQTLYPHLDDSRVADSKIALRRFAGTLVGKPLLNAIHVTDNSAEAVDCATVLGLDRHPAVAPRIRQLREAARSEAEV